MTEEEIDPRICPLCGKPNDCALARGESACWCFETSHRRPHAI